MEPRAESLELLVERAEGALRLLSPEVGEFTCARGRGALLAAGADAGALIVLGRAVRLCVPEGIEGRVTSARPERVHAPVGFRAVLYELEPVEAGGAAFAAEPEAEAALGKVFRAPQSGRFYHCPGPDAPPFVTAGAELEDGQPVGLIEVMKTFAVVPYRATGGLPQRARVARVLIADGGEVSEGDPLLELE